MKIIAVNKRARYDYTILNKYEVGIVLNGWEVKSIRQNNVNLNACYLNFHNNELFIINLKIGQYMNISFDETRTRKILMHKRELIRIKHELDTQKLALIPLKLYFNKKSLVKLEIALARGKTLIDKRQSIKQREWERHKLKLNKIY